MKDAYYFSHDSNARHDPKILKVRAKYGPSGYAWYFMIIETMREQSNYCIDSDDFDALAMDLQCERSAFEGFVQYCLSIGLFELQENKIFSQSLLYRMQKYEDRSEKARSSAKKRWDANAMRTHSECNALKQSKGKEIKQSKTNTSSGYEFYINNINLMPSPYETEKVIDVINQYTDEWFINACKVAIQNNARKINYIEAVLKKSKEKGTGVTESKKESYEQRRAHAEKMEREAQLK